MKAWKWVLAQAGPENAPGGPFHVLDIIVLIQWLRNVKKRN